VIAEGPLRRHVIRVDMPLENELGAGRHLQVRTQASGHLGAPVPGLIAVENPDSPPRRRR